MNEEQLLDLLPPFRVCGNQPSFRDYSQPVRRERLVIDRLMKRATCITGPCHITCWLTSWEWGGWEKALCRKRFMVIPGTGGENEGILQRGLLRSSLEQVVG